MKELEKLNLKDVEELDTVRLMSYSTSGGSGSDDGAGDFGDGSGDMSFICPDECTSHEDCARKLGISSSGAYCNRVGCYEGLVGNYMKCFEMTKSEIPCRDKELHSRCTMSDGNPGYCSIYYALGASWRAKRCVPWKFY
jgi:hypothetical protein